MRNRRGIALTAQGRISVGRFTVVLLAVFWWAPGCATKEIALESGAGGEDAGAPGDAALKDVSASDAALEARFPAPFCIPFAAADGGTCTACYDEWGNETSRACKPPIKCQVREDPSATRCLYCDDNPTLSRACLKCELPVAGCSQCVWPDLGATCRRCVDAAGVVTTDSCDALRKELM